MDIHWEPDAMEHVYGLIDKALETDLGPQVKGQVIRKTPIDTGALISTVEAEVDRAEHKLYIIATGDQSRLDPSRRDYATYVDKGHWVVAWGNPTTSYVQPTFFMRQALYQRYPGW